MNDDALLTTKQAADALGIKEARVRQLAQSGALPAARIGRDWVIRRADLEIARARTTRRGPVPGSKRAADTPAKP